MVGFDLHRADQRGPVGAGVLFEHCQKIDERCDCGPGRAKETVANSIGAVLHELGDGLIGEKILGGIATRINMADLRQQHIEVFRRQAGQAHNRATEIHQAVGGKGVLSQATL